MLEDQAGPVGEIAVAGGFEPADVGDGQGDGLPEQKLGVAGRAAGLV